MIFKAFLEVEMKKDVQNKAVARKFLTKIKIMAVWSKSITFRTKFSSSFRAVTFYPLV